MTNTSIKLLLEDIQRRFSMKYVLTYRLNQDVLDIFFCAMRSKGGLYDHPDALEFRNRLRSYILGRNEGSYSSFGNVEDDDTPSVEIDELNLCGAVFSSVKVIENSEEPLDKLEEELSDIEYDGLEHLAGYICHKIKQDDNASRVLSQEYTWTSHLSEGGLTRPSPEIMNQMQELEKIFQLANSDSLLITKNYIQKLLNSSASVSGSEDCKKLFFRTRMYFRIKSLNAELHNSAITRKKKLQKLLNK